jgi:tetratricopeptide (TPR) repeat protein
MAGLTDADYKRLKALCAEGDQLADDEHYAQALVKYWEAFDLIPEPREDWEATLWVLVAIGDANFLNKDFEAGRDNLSNAMRCDGAVGNPFIHLRLGQCQFELGNLDRAADEFTRAYAVAGEEIFAEEEQKYTDFLRTRIQMN